LQPTNSSKAWLPADANVGEDENLKLGELLESLVESKEDMSQLDREVSEGCPWSLVGGDQSKCRFP
jgi:hypothetical protein